MIFKVRVGGTEKIVRFSEPNNNNSTTVFLTSDKALIAAIRGHKFYKQGKIREMREPGDAIDDAVQTAQAADKKTRSEAPARKAVAAVVKEPEEQSGVLNFESFSQLKNYLKKTYGQEAAGLKNVAQVAKFAKDKGIAYTYNKQK